MSWVELLPDAALKPGTPAVSVTVNKADGRFKQRMVLTIRTAAVEGAERWCKPGAPVRIERGVGDKAGSYRLSSAGPWKFRNSAGHIKAISISLPAPPGAPGDGCKQTPVRFSHDGAGILEFALPDWGQRAAKAKQPYVGISERVPDPAAMIQAANGTRVR